MELKLRLHEPTLDKKRFIGKDLQIAIKAYRKRLSKCNKSSFKICQILKRKLCTKRNQTFCNHDLLVLMFESMIRKKRNRRKL